MVELTKDFPPGLVNKWIHKDVLESILRLGGAINQLYRAVASIAVTSGQGLLVASVSHSSNAVLVTGFSSGLTPDAWIGGSILINNQAAGTAGTLYSAQITDNDTTTITISNGGDLPVVYAKPCILTMNNQGSLISLSSLNMINFAEPVWEVLTDAGVQVPPINIDLAQNILQVPQYDGKIYYYVRGQNVVLALGSGAVASGTWVVGYYILPVEATAETDCIDFPIEYHGLSQTKTIIRILKKKGQTNEATQKEGELDAMFQRYDESNMGMAVRDKALGERK
jgi:hypothetical protein